MFYKKYTTTMEKDSFVDGDILKVLDDTRN